MKIMTDCLLLLFRIDSHIKIIDVLYRHNFCILIYIKIVTVMIQMIKTNNKVNPQTLDIFVLFRFVLELSLETIEIDVDVDLYDKKSILYKIISVN